MTYRIAKRFAFSAAHHLKGLPPTHPCSRVHGHNYEVEVVLSSPTVNAVGFVVDYRDMDAFKAWIDEHLDHLDLNKALGPEVNPTAENLAKRLYDLADYWWGALVHSVRVSETPKTWAEYRKDY